MGDPNEFFVPAAPKNLPMRPLDKGMFLNMAPVLIPVGGAVDLANLHVIEGGLKRRPGIEPYGVSTSGSHYAMSFAVQGTKTFWRADGASVMAFWDTKMVYTLSTGGWGRKLWTYQSGTVSAGVLTAAGTGTGWLSVTTKALVGDLMSFGAPLSGLREIRAIASNTLITLSAAPGGAGAGAAYKIRRCFSPPTNILVDSSIIDNKLIFTDANRKAYSFDGITFQEWVCTWHTTLSSPGRCVPGCISFFNNRTWLGNTVETLAAGGTTVYRNRIRWSRTTDHSNFQDTASADSQWVDLPYSQGWLMRLVPMGDMLAALFSDSIYLGISTNMPTLPLMFNKIETGGIGLIGMGAVGSFLGTIFMVGNDDIYTLKSQGIERIGTPVVARTIRTCSNPDKIRVAVDPLNDRIVFGFPETGTSIVKVWSYFYKSKAWSYDEIECTMVGLMQIVIGPTWDTLSSLISPNNWDVGLPAKYGTWDSMMPSSAGFKLVFGKQNGTVFQLSTSDSQDMPGTPIPVRIEMGDYDYDMPDDEKVWIRLSIKLRASTPTQLNLIAHTSNDRGNNWKAVGVLIVRANEDEGYVNFRASGAILRFKLESSDVIVPYTIDEAVLRVRGKGLETRAVAS